MSTDKSIWKPHVTVAAICEQAGRFLMVKERINGQEVYNQPAGHLDPDESLLDAVIRETLEETSYPFVPEKITGIYRYKPDADKDKTYLRISFSGTVGESLNLPLDTGIISAEWLTLEEIRNLGNALRTEMVIECILDYLNGQSYPLTLFNKNFL